MIKNYTAGAAIAARRIVKHGGADGAVIQGAAATDALIGVCVQPAGAALNERVDVAHEGIADVEYGGTVTRGGLLTSDATGRAVAAAPGAGVNNRIIGVAVVSGAISDIGQVLIALGSLQGA